MPMIATLQDAIYVALGWDPTYVASTPRRERSLQKIYSEVAKTLAVTENDSREWGGQPNLHHRIRSELAKMVKEELVERTRPATYRLL